MKLGHRRIAINLQATVTAYWLRRGIEAAASTLDVELFLSPVDLPAHGEDPAALAQLDAFLAECESFGSRRCWCTPTSTVPGWWSGRWSVGCASPRTWP